MPVEKDLDRALKAALEGSDHFRAWFVSQIPGAAGFTQLVLCRADHPWGKVRAILPDEASGALRAVDRECETDVLAVFEGPGQRRIGVHIENKLASGAFTEFQADLYAFRAEQWVGLERYGPYHEWCTVLLAPALFIQANASESRKFMVRLTHEQVAPMVPAYGSPGDA